MKTSDELEKTAIVAEKLIGTKWNGWSEIFPNRISVEFVDRKNCIYTAQPRKFPLTYNVRGGELYINNIDGAFELRGNVLFNSDIPVFEKAA